MIDKRQWATPTPQQRQVLATVTRSMRRAVTAAWVAISVLGCAKDPSATRAADAVAQPAGQQIMAPPAPAQLWHEGWQRQAEWPKQAVDVLLLAAAPGLEPGQVDASTRAIVTTWRKLDGVEAVYSRATEGEFRAVIRWQQGRRDPRAALASVVDAWNGADPRGLGPAHTATVARGERARVAWAVTSLDGAQVATAVAGRAAPLLLDWMTDAARVQVAGAVRPALYGDLLTRTMADKGVDFDGVAAAVSRGLQVAEGPPLLDDAASQNRVFDALSRQRIAAAGASAGVAVTDVVTLRRGLGGPVRGALVGRVEPVLLTVQGGVGDLSEGLDSREAAVRNHPQFKAMLAQAKAQLHPQSVGPAYRAVLQVREGKAPESMAELGERLFAVRELPGVVGVAASSGLDGIPETVDVHAQQRSRWTVWVTASGSDVAGIIGGVSARLADGPWQVTWLPANLDTALAWMLDEVATVGALVSADDVAGLAPAVSQVAVQLRGQMAVGQLRSGPSPRQARAAFARLRTDAVHDSGLPTQRLAEALRLLDGPVLAGHWQQTPLWFTLPGGVMAAEQGSMPIGKSADPTAQVRRVADFVQPAVGREVTERIRVDGALALWLVGETTDGQPHLAIQTFRDAVDRSNLGTQTGLRWTSWTLADPVNHGERCAP